MTVLHRLAFWRIDTAPSPAATRALEHSELTSQRTETIVGSLEHEVLIRNHIGERLIAALGTKEE